MPKQKLHVDLGTDKAMKDSPSFMMIKALESVLYLTLLRVCTCMKVLLLFLDRNSHELVKIQHPNLRLHHRPPFLAWRDHQCYQPWHEERLDQSSRQG
jgi:hypothetical protein